MSSVKFILDAQFTLIVNYDIESDVYSETLKVEGFGEITMEQDEPEEQYSFLAEQCLLAIIEHPFGTEASFAERTFNIFNDKEFGLGVSIQKGPEEYIKELDDYAYSTEMFFMKKTEMKKLYEFFKEAQNLALGELIKERLS